MLFLSRPAHKLRLLVTILALSASATVTANGRMSDRAAEHAQGGGPGMVEVIVQYNAMPDQAQADYAANLGAETTRAYDRLPMRAMRVPAQALNGLANGNSVRFVSLDGAVEAFTEAARLTTNMVYAKNGAQMFDGNGVGVAVIDSGVSNPPVSG